MNENEKIIVYQNIEESPIFYQYENFKNRIEWYLKEETYKIMNRYKVLNDRFFEILKEVLLISYYKKIEKRGFRVYLNEVRYKEDVK